MNGYIDMHCDTLMIGMQRKLDTVSELKGSMLDVERLKKSGAEAQFFAMFLSQNDRIDTEDQLAEMHRIFRATLEEQKDALAFAGNYADLEANKAAGKISAFLTIENGHPVRGKYENIKRFYDLGVRLITLTWNDPNCFGQCNSKDPELMKKGLSAFGKEAVAYMNELGVIIDVSHLSDGGFFDVAELSRKPFVASHSNARALAPHQRNMTDKMIRTLADCGGVAGLNFEPSFLNADITDPHSTVERMCDHAEYIINLGGEECLGIGSDFDGIGGEHEIFDCTRVSLLFDGLHRRGFSDDLIDRIRFGNVERVIKDTL